MKNVRIALFCFSVCSLLCASPPGYATEKTEHTYIAKEEKPTFAGYAIEPIQYVLINNAVGLELQACAVLSTEAILPVGTKTATVELKTKTTVAASTDSYCYQRVSNSNVIIFNEIFDPRKNIGLHIDPGLKIGENPTTYITYRPY